MIYNLIGSGILVAVGAIPVWAFMCLKLVDAQRQADCFASRADRLTADLRDRDATISRLSDTVGQIQYKRDKALEYCKQFRVRGAVVAGILSGEQDQ